MSSVTQGEFLLCRRQDAPRALVRWQEEDEACCGDGCTYEQTQEIPHGVHREEGQAHGTDPQSRWQPPDIPRLLSYGLMAVADAKT
jgi:hypothetical protein